MEISEDLRLIMRFKGGDLYAFEKLVVKYQDRIYNLCRYTLGNARDADDAVQDIFIKAYRNLKDFKPEKPFYTWLYRIGVNTCLDFRRKSFSASSFLQSLSREMAATADQSLFDTTPEKLYELKETRKAIEFALAKLPEKLRAVIILREIEQLTYEEIAEIMNSSIGTVKSRISRAREMLRETLKENLKE
jgi:RNA polymerase sigma-70 factor (ECF subfamily)